MLSFSEVSEELRGKASDLLLGSDHDLRYEVHNGAGRLLWIVLRKQVAHVVGGAALLPRNEPEHPARATTERVRERTGVASFRKAKKIPREPKAPIRLHLF